MNCDFIVFGYGHDGVLRDTEYNGEDTVALEPAVGNIAHHAMANNNLRIRILGPVIFDVRRHRSRCDGLEYYIAIGEEANEQEISESVDLIIAGFRPRPAI